MLAEHGAVQMQVVGGRARRVRPRSLSITRAWGPPGETACRGEWTRHAGGDLASGGAVVERSGGVGERARALGRGVGLHRAPGGRSDGFYDALAEQGFEYGPAFQGVRAVWRHGEELFAEVALSPRSATQAAGFQPAPGAARFCVSCRVEHARQRRPARSEAPGGPGAAAVLLQRRGISRRGGSSLRVSLSPGEDGAISLVAADENGGLVASSTRWRCVSLASRWARARVHRESLFGMDWGEIRSRPGPSPRRRRPRPTHLQRRRRRGRVDGAGRRATRLWPGRCARSGRRRDVADLQGLGEAVDRGGPVPVTVLVDCGRDGIPGA